MNPTTEVPDSSYVFVSPGETNQFINFLDDLARRAMDVIVSGLGLLFLSPFFLFIALLIKRDSPGPVFYRGLRAGRYGRSFGILKFRTMYERPDSYAGARVTAQGDARITPLGQWLRNTKVNEMPQLWNVLVGEMSLVGPRPEDPDIVAADWPEAVRDEILSVRPGITSPASVVYRNEEQMLTGKNVMDDYLKNVVPSKLRLDLMYVRSRNILTDFDAIFWTAIVLLPQLRRQSVPEHLLYWGPASRLFSQYINWFVVDWLVAFLSMAAAGLFWRTLGPYDVGVGESMLLALAASSCFSLLNYILGLNHINWARTRPSGAFDLVFSAGAMTALLALANKYIFPAQLYPTRMLVTSGILAMAGFIAMRYRERLITGLASRWLSLRNEATGTGERVLIVGAGEMGNFASWMFRHSDFARLFTVVGMVDDDPRKVGTKIDSHNVLGTVENIPNLVEKNNIGLIVFAINRIHPLQRDHILHICKNSPARLVVFPDIMAYLQSSLSKPEMWAIQDVAYTDHSADALAAMRRAGQEDEIRASLDAIEEALNQGNLALARMQLSQLREQYSEKVE